MKEVEEQEEHEKEREEAEEREASNIHTHLVEVDGLEGQLAQTLAALAVCLGLGSNP